MAKKLFRIILPLIIISLLVVGNTGCTYFSPLVGKWQDSQSQNTIEFTRDGKVILTSNGYLTSGTYQLFSSDVVKINYEGLSRGMASLFGIDTWQYTISGNTMTVVAGGGTDVFNRVGSPTTTRTIQTTANSPTIVVTYPKGGETFHVGQVITITWKTTNLSNTVVVNIGYTYPDGGAFFPSSSEGMPNTGSYKLTIPKDITLNGGKAQITIANSQSLVAEGSSGFFTVTN